MTLSYSEYREIRDSHNHNLFGWANASMSYFIHFLSDLNKIRQISDVEKNSSGHCELRELGPVESIAEWRRESTSFDTIWCMTSAHTAAEILRIQNIWTGKAGIARFSYTHK
jgi:hypothetical protein